MRHVCALKLCLLLTAVMSNDVGAAAEYLSTPRPIIGWHHLLLLHLKTEGVRFRYFHYSFTYKRHIS